MKFDNIEELMNYQKNEINQSMKEVDREIKCVHKRYNLFKTLYYRLIMRIRLKRRISKSYARINSEF